MGRIKWYLDFSLNRLSLGLCDIRTTDNHRVPLESMKDRVFTYNQLELYIIQLAGEDSIREAVMFTKVFEHLYEWSGTSDSGIVVISTENEGR